MTDPLSRFAETLSKGIRRGVALIEDTSRLERSAPVTLSRLTDLIEAARAAVARVTGNVAGADEAAVDDARSSARALASAFGDRVVTDALEGAFSQSSAAASGVTALDKVRDRLSAEVPSAWVHARASALAARGAAAVVAAEPFAAGTVAVLVVAAAIRRIRDAGGNVARSESGLKDRTLGVSPVIRGADVSNILRMGMSFGFAPALDLHAADVKVKGGAAAANTLDITVPGAQSAVFFSPGPLIDPRPRPGQDAAAPTTAPGLNRAVIMRMDTIEHVAVPSAAITISADAPHAPTPCWTIGGRQLPLNPPKFLKLNPRNDDVSVDRWIPDPRVEAYARCLHDDFCSQTCVRLLDDDERAKSIENLQEIEPIVINPHQLLAAVRKASARMTGQRATPPAVTLGLVSAARDEMFTQYVTALRAINSDGREIAVAALGMSENAATIVKRAAGRSMYQAGVHDPKKPLTNVQVEGVVNELFSFGTGWVFLSADRKLSLSPKVPTCIVLGIARR